jgi:phage shock protein A
LLVAKHRRSRALGKASQARIAAGDQTKMGAFDRMKDKIHGDEAMSHALAELATENIDDRLEALGKDDEVERLLAEIKNKKGVA